MNAVMTKKLSFRYEGQVERALDRVDFKLDYGEVALLSGCSGSGKSTLLSVICGIIPHVVSGDISGKAYVSGEDIGGMTMAEICRKVGVVLQNADAQIIQNTVEDEIAFGCENFGMPREKIAENIARACEMMSLSPSWDTRTLSGGQKQRLMTACTLATDQKIIVLDEPLANLDGEGTELLLGALKRLAAAGYAVLITEHRVDKVAPYADTIWHMENGRLSKPDDKAAYMRERAERIEDSCKSKPTAEKLFSVEKVGFSAGGREILTGVDLEVYKGERLLILGENGSGKTTLTRLIAGLSRPSQGEIRQFLDPKFDRKRGNRKWFERVGVVYQNPNYQLFMPTVEKEIAFGAKNKDLAAKTAKLFGLEKLLKRHPQSLSEGQKRLVTVAAVCASAPDVLILDEPTVGQDYENLKRLTELVNKIHEETGNTVMTVTHDARCADALCDRAAVVSGGRITETGGKEVAAKFFGKFGD